MGQSVVELQVGGQIYRVVATADTDELRDLAAVVDEKLTGLKKSSGRAMEQNMLLVALALAHEAKEAQAKQAAAEAKHAATEKRSREMLRELLDRVDQALIADDDPQHDDAQPAEMVFRPADSPPVVHD